MAQIATERSERQVVALANPAPLGLSALALTTFVFSCSNAGLFLGATIIIGPALFYGGLAQFLAGMWEFRTGNTFGATAFSSYGAFWFALGFTLWQHLLPNAIAFGFFLLGWTIFTGVMLFGTFRLSCALISVFGLLFITFLLLAIGNLTGVAGFGQIAGWVGIVSSSAAWYTALAGILSATNSAFLLPTFPMG